MARLACLLTVVTLGSGLPTTARALEPLERFSAEAGVVVRLKAPDATIDTTAQFVDAVQTGLGDMVRQNAQGLGQTIFVPSLAGVDRSRNWYLFVFATPGERPNVVFAIPTTNVDEFKQAVSKQMTVEIEGDWAFYTASPNGVPAAPSNDTAVSSIMTGELADVFQRGDLSLFVNVAQLTKSYANELANAQQQAHTGLEQFGKIMQQGAKGMDLEGLVTFYGSLLDGMFQMVKDAGGSSVALKITAEGIGIEKHTTFADGSATSMRLAAQPTSTMDALARQPADAVGYFGVSCDMQQMIDWGMSMTRDMLGDNPEQQMKFDEAIKAWKQIDFKQMTGSLSIETEEEGLLEYSIYAQATPVDKVRSTMRDVSKLMGNVETYGIKQTMTLKEDAETIDSHSVDVMTITQEIPPELDPTGMQARMREVMFGPDGMVARIAYLDDGYVQTMGGGRQAMETALKAIDGPPNADLADDRTGLMDRSNLLVMFDLPHAISRGLQSADEMPDLPFEFDTDELMQLDLETSYIGATLAAQQNALHSQLVVPVEQVRGIAKLVNFFRSQRKP